MLDPGAPVDRLSSMPAAESSGFSPPSHEPGDASSSDRSDGTPEGVRAPGNHMRWAQADILVVDDDDDVRASMAAVLRSVGYRVVEASDGQSALDVLVGTNVAVVLLDLHMSPRDGIWLLEHMEAPPVVVVVSAFAMYDESSVRAQFSNRVAAFLRKPVAPPKLIEATRKAFGSPASS
jgi:CheY-like chemotaxis protein